MTAEDIKALQDKVQALESENRKQADALAAANSALDKAQDSQKVALKPIAGKAKVEWKGPNDTKKQTRTVTFKDGQRAVRLKSGETVESASLMKLATGGELTDDELKISPSLTGKTKEFALERLGQLAAAKYPGLEDA